METALLGAAEARVRCPEGDPCNVDWACYKSGFDRYWRFDTFGEELQSEVRGRLDPFKGWLSWLTLGFTVAAFATYLLTFFGKGNCCMQEYLGRLIEGTDYLLSLLERGFGAELYQLRTGFGSATLVLTAGLAAEMDCSRRTYRAILKIFREAFGEARPIFAGSGQLQFSLGDCGIAVTGGNSEHHFNWGAVETARLVKKDKVSGSFGQCRTKLPHFTFDVKPRAATHLIVLMKLPRTEERDKKAIRAAEKAAKKLGEAAPLASKDFLVIPEHFFHAPVDGCSWQEFLRHFQQHICVAGWAEE